LTIKDKELSPKVIYQFFKDAFSKGNNYFMNGSVINDSLDFLKNILDLEMESLNGEQRRDILRHLSKSTVKMWGELLRQALDTLDNGDDFEHHDTIRGVSRLKQYLSKFKEFEILLYGSDEWYRDTIYHQLWFFFVGLYLFSYKDQDRSLMDLLIEKKYWYCDPSDEIRDKTGITQDKARYAFFCVIALCHDLGKPLQMVHPINDAIRAMLKEYKFLHFSPFKVEFPITYEAMLNSLVERLGQIGIPYKDKDSSPFTTRIGREIGGREERKNDSYYIKMEKYMHKEPHMQSTFSTTLAELNHGMISCLLLMESFRRFKGTEIYQNWRIDQPKDDPKEIWIHKSYMTSQYILKSIAYHSIENLEIIEIDLPLFWILLVDDLIEDYRPTRAGKDFMLYNLCNVKIKKFSIEDIHIRFEFNHPVKKKPNLEKKKELDQEINKEANFENKDNINFEDDFIFFFIDKLERYFYLLQLKDFKFTMEIIELSGDKERYQIIFNYARKKDQKDPNINVKLKD